MHLYVLPPSPRARKVIALRNYLKIDAEVRTLDYLQGDQLTPLFAQVNPNRRMPVLTEDGWALWESNAILFYFATKAPGSGLWPTASRDQADVIRWLSWESSHWDPAWDILITEHFKKKIFVTRESGRRTGGATSTPLPPDPQRVAEGVRCLRELSAVLDSHLANRSWLVGSRLTIADFAVATWIPTATATGFSLDDFGEIKRWYSSIAALPGWQGALSPPPKLRPE